MTNYVAYSDLGKGSGAPVDPADYGGVDSQEFQYLLARRVVLPEGDRDAPPLPPGFEVKAAKPEEKSEGKPEEKSEGKPEEKPTSSTSTQSKSSGASTQDASAQSSIRPKNP